MIYQDIPLREINEAIARLFPASLPGNGVLSPDALHQVAGQCGVTLDWARISWWQHFMTDSPLVTDTTFTALLLPGIEAGDRVFLVTDEGLLDQTGFSFRYADFAAFVEAYEERYRMEFFQDADYIFVVPAKRQLSILMHEGWYTVWRQP